MIRAGMREIERVFNAAVVADPATVVGVKAVAVDKKLRFRGEVGIGESQYVIADDKGKVKTFTDVDDLVKTVAQYMPTSSGSYLVQVDTGALLVRPLPSDLVKAAQSDLVKLNAKKAAASAVVTALDANLALMVGWETGNALQVARKAEVTAERGAVVADVAAIDAEIARLTAIVTPT